MKTDSVTLSPSQVLRVIAMLESLWGENLEEFDCHACGNDPDERRACECQGERDLYALLKGAVTKRDGESGAFINDVVSSWKAEELLWREREEELLRKLASYEAGAELLIEERDRLRRLLSVDHASDCAAMTQDVPCSCGWNSEEQP